MTTEQQIQFCNKLATLSADVLLDIFKALTLSVSIMCPPSHTSGDERLDKDDSQEPKKPQDPIAFCTECLKRNSKAVREIIRTHHNDIATMVYSLGLVVGNQLIQSGTVNSMTAVYTLLMYLAKVGLDKVLSDSKDSPDDTSDEGKGDTK